MEKNKTSNGGTLKRSENLQPALIAEVNNNIVTIRETSVLIDRDVAAIYGVATRDINKAVKNNPRKFPSGYYFELNAEEKRELVEKFHRFESLKHSTVMPKAFSEKGLYMLAGVKTIRLLITQILEQEQVPADIVCKALNKCKSYIWGHSAYAVAFCVCRDLCGWQDNASYFERQMQQQGIVFPPGTINTTISRNPFMKLNVDKWDGNGVMERVIKLRDEFQQQVGFAEQCKQKA